MEKDDLLNIFIYGKEENLTHCTLCSTTFKRYNKWNLNRHYKKCFQQTTNQKHCADGAIARHMNYIKFTVTTRQIVESCIRIVTVQGKPLADLNSDGFRNLFEPVSSFINLNFFVTFRVILDFFYLSMPTHLKNMV